MTVFSLCLQMVFSVWALKIMIINAPKQSTFIHALNMFHIRWLNSFLSHLPVYGPVYPSLLNLSDRSLSCTCAKCTHAKSRPTSVLLTMCYRLNCVLPNSYVKVQVPSNGTLFRDRIITKEIKLKWGHWGNLTQYDWNKRENLDSDKHGGKTVWQDVGRRSCLPAWGRGLP